MSLWGAWAFLFQLPESYPSLEPGEVLGFMKFLIERQTRGIRVKLKEHSYLNIWSAQWGSQRLKRIYTCWISENMVKLWVIDLSLITVNICLGIRCTYVLYELHVDDFQEGYFAFIMVGFFRKLEETVRLKRNTVVITLKCGQRHKWERFKKKHPWLPH